MVGIVILNFNNPQITINCIESIERWNSYPCKIAIVDNASTDNSVAVLDSYLNELTNCNYHRQVGLEEHLLNIPKYSLLISKQNTGYAQGNNVGCFYFDCDVEVDYILILNNDTIFIQDIIPPMVNFQMNHSDCAITNVLLLKKDGVSIEFNTARNNCTIGELLCLYAHLNQRYLEHNKRNQILANNPELLDYDSLEVEIPMGSCLLLKKTIFRQLGYFDTHTFLYFEENILFAKIKRMGLKNYLLPKYKLIHIGGATINQTKFNYFQEMKRSYSSYYYGLNYSGMSVLMKPLFILLYYFHLIILNIKYALSKI